MRQIGFIQKPKRPKLVIYFDDKITINPYRIYYEWYEPSEHGLKKRKRLQEKFADLDSCGEFINWYIKDWR